MFGMSEKKPKPSMLGSGMAAKAGSTLEIQRRLREFEMRMTDPDYIPTEAEKSEMMQLRGRLEEMNRKK